MKYLNLKEVYIQRAKIETRLLNLMNFWCQWLPTPSRPLTLSRTAHSQIAKIKGIKYGNCILIFHEKFSICQVHVNKRWKLGTVFEYFWDFWLKFSSSAKFQNVVTLGFISAWNRTSSFLICWYFDKIFFIRKCISDAATSPSNTSSINQALSVPKLGNNKTHINMSNSCIIHHLVITKQNKFLFQADYWEENLTLHLSI